MIRAHAHFVAASFTNQFLHNFYVIQLARRRHYLGLLNYFVDFLKCTNKLSVDTDKKVNPLIGLNKLNVRASKAARQNQIF